MQTPQELTCALDFLQYFDLLWLFSGPSCYILINKYLQPYFNTTNI